MNPLLEQAITCGVLESYLGYCPRCYGTRDIRLQDARNTPPPSGPFGPIYMCLQCQALFAFDQAPAYYDEDEPVLFEGLIDLLALLHCPVSQAQRETPHWQRLLAFQEILDAEETLDV